jgi:hypothetical protein
VEEDPVADMMQEQASTLLGTARSEAAARAA